MNATFYFVKRIIYRWFVLTKHNSQHVINLLHCPQFKFYQNSFAKCSVGNSDIVSRCRTQWFRNVVRPTYASAKWTNIMYMSKYMMMMMMMMRVN